MIRHPWTQQPPSVTPLDPSNPLTRSLVLLVTPQNRVIDATGRVTLARDSTETLTAFSRGGIAGRYVNNGFTFAGTTVTGARTTIGADGWWMVALEGFLVNLPASTSNALLEDNTGSSNLLRFSTLGEAQIVMASSIRVTSSNTVAAGQPFRVVFWGANGVTNNVTLNGVTTSAVDGGFGALGPIGTIGGGSGFATEDIAITQIAAWQGLDLARSAAWQANPWQLFAPLPSSIWLAAAAASVQLEDVLHRPALMAILAQ